jgi:hypothetical protein
MRFAGTFCFPRVGCGMHCFFVGVINTIKNKEKSYHDEATEPRDRRDRITALTVELPCLPVFLQIAKGHGRTKDQKRHSSTQPVSDSVTIDDVYIFSTYRAEPAMPDVS